MVTEVGVSVLELGVIKKKDHFRVGLLTHGKQMTNTVTYN